MMNPILAIKAMLGKFTIDKKTQQQFPNIRVQLTIKNVDGADITLSADNVSTLAEVMQMMEGFKV